MTTRQDHPQPVGFRKVKPRKVSAIVAEQIVDAIQHGDFPVGDRLPSETELAERMGVSRPSVREALSALQAVGLVESKAGSGNYVRRAPAGDEEVDAPHLIESEAGCLEVLEAREALEPPLAAYVAERAPTEAVERLKAIVRSMRAQARRNDFPAYFAEDKAFHRALADVVGNRLLSAALAPLVGTMDQRVYREFTHHYYLKNVADMEQVVDLHEEIVEAIAARRPEQAAERMREHWRRMREIWET